MDGMEQIQNADQSVIADCLTPEALAKQLGNSVRTLDRWHSLRIGPPRIRIGRTILYRRESVLEWLRAREDRMRSQGNTRRRRAA